MEMRSPQLHETRSLGEQFCHSCRQQLGEQESVTAGIIRLSLERPTSARRSAPLVEVSHVLALQLFVLANVLFSDIRKCPLRNFPTFLVIFLRYNVSEVQETGERCPSCASRTPPIGWFFIAARSIRERHGFLRFSQRFGKVALLHQHDAKY